jgi:hypothetical protein
MQTGQTRYGTQVLRVPALQKDGTRRSIAFTVALLHAPDDRCTGIAAIVRDDTKRWQEEQILRQRLAALGWSRSREAAAGGGVVGARCDAVCQ